MRGDNVEIKRAQLFTSDEAFDSKIITNRMKTNFDLENTSILLRFYFLSSRFGSTAKVSCGPSNACETQLRQESNQHCLSLFASGEVECFQQENDMFAFYYLCNRLLLAN